MRVKPYAIRFPSRNARHTALSAPGGCISTPGCSCRTAQASGPALAARGGPLARASIAIRQAVSATVSRNHLLPVIVVVAMSAFRPHGCACAYHRPRYHLRIWSRCQAAPHRPTTGVLATAERWLRCSWRRLDTGQPTLMPMCVRCIWPRR